jgi:mRNA-degrading endonuclease RelE of RelBE toxin-antitoxin system
MVIIETPIFTRIIKEIMSDDEYRELQEALVNRPNSGDLIKKSGGLRKVRWKLQGRGKSGGIRVIYYWMVSE